MSTPAAGYSRRATPRRARSSWPPRAARGLAVETTSTRCWAATARRWRWTWRATGRPTPAAADRQQRLPRRRGLLRLRRAGRAAGRRRWHAAARRRRRGGAVRPRAQPVRLLLVAAHDARERRPEPQLPRLHAEPLPQRRPTTSSPPLSCPRTGRPSGRRTMRSSSASSPSTAQRALQAADLGRPVPPSARACSTAAARRPGATRRCARCCASTARRCRRLGLDRPAHRARAERPRRAHLRRPRRRRRRMRAPGPGGATSRRSTTAPRPRRC